MLGFFYIEHEEKAITYTFLINSALPIMKSSTRQKKVLTLTIDTMKQKQDYSKKNIAKKIKNYISFQILYLSNFP